MFSSAGLFRIEYAHQVLQIHAHGPAAVWATLYVVPVIYHSRPSDKPNIYLGVQFYHSIHLWSEGDGGGGVCIKQISSKFFDQKQYR